MTNQKQIDKLTPEQEAKIPEYLERYMAIGLSTEPCDRAKAEAAVTASYLYLKKPAPTFVWADSPFEGARIAAQLATGKDDVTDKDVAAQAEQASYGSFEAYWVAFYAFISEQLPVQKPDNLIDIAKDIVINCGVYWTFEDIVVMTDKPKKICMENKQLHNPEGLALEYRDGSGIFAINGKRYKSLFDVAIQNEMSDDDKKTEEAS